MRPCWILSLLMFAGISNALHAETLATGGSAVVWSKQCQGYIAKVPQGWYLDNQLGINAGVDMLLLPEGDPPTLNRNLPIYAYVMPTVKQDKNGTKTTVAQLIAWSIDDFKSSDDAVTSSVSHPKDWLPANAQKESSRQLTVVDIQSPANKKYEKIVYDEIDEVIFAVTLSAQSQELLAKNEIMVKNIVQNAMFWLQNNATPPCPTIPITK